MKATELTKGMRFYNKNEKSYIIEIEKVTEKSIYIKGNGRWGVNRLLRYIETGLYILIV